MKLKKQDLILREYLNAKKRSNGLSDAEKRKFLKKHGLPVLINVIRSEGGKKGKVGILLNGKPKLIRFGDASMGHNYSPEARRSFKARHAKNIARGKISPAYWANKCLWQVKGVVQTPKAPKTQKRV